MTYRRSMLVWALFSILACIPGLASAQSSFAGWWLGAWSSGSDKGNVYIAVDANGDLSGTMLNFTRGTWGALDGAIGPDGALFATIPFDNSPSITLRGTVKHSGRNLSCDLVQTPSGQRVRATLKPDPFRGADSSPAALVGTWSGTWKSDQLGNAELTFNADGSVSGVFENLTYNLRGEISGRATPQGDFYGIVTYSGGAERTIVSTFKVSSGKATGTLIEDLQSSGVFKAAFTLTRGPLPNRQSVARLVGRWTGSWSGDGQRGKVDITIYPDGSVVGTISNTGYRISGPFAGTARANGTMAGTLRYPNSTLRISALIERWGVSNVGSFTDGNITGTFALKASR